LRILVTGGAGYIGSAVAAGLVEAGHEVVVYDNLSKGSKYAVSTGATLLVGDVSDRAFLSQFFRQHSFDGVMHFAAFIDALAGNLLSQQYWLRVRALLGL
jgi:UDP-glucose 4-epimerase